jgi:hypothetical protein
MSEAIIVAVVVAVGGVLAAMVQLFRRENNADHALVSQALNRIETKVDTHIGDHARGDL